MTQNISRRTLAKGAAWSVPAVVAAAPVYAAAASADQYSVDCSAPFAFQIAGVKPALTGEGTANGSSTGDIGVGQWSFPSGVTLTERATGAKKQASGYYINWGFTNSTACENPTGTGSATVTGTSAKGTHFTGAVTSYTPYRCSPQAIGAGLSSSFTIATKGLQGSQALTCSDSRDWAPGKISVPFSITFLDGLNASAGKATSCQYYLNLNFQTNK